MASGGAGSRVSCGRDLSCVPEVADTLAAVAKLGFDFLCMPLFHPRFRREYELDPAKSRPGAQTRSDLLLCGRDWNTLIVGKLSPWIETDSELTTERRNSEEALVQELNFCAYLGLPAFMIPLRGPHCANLARILLNHIHTGHHSCMFIFTGANRHSEKDMRSYLQYLEYLNQNRPAPNAYELFAKGYEDYLQSPLQPLMDNLESQTYEVFEKDPIKYSQYQQAVYRCLLDRVPEEQMETTVQVLMVLGAGRGPLVNASLRAAKQAKRKLRVYAVEKNPNAVVTLENWKFEEWGDQVTVVSCDMREWTAPEKADIIVSELLGSFGDNELSPECLDGAQHFLKDDGISIPCSYTSFLAPLSSSKLYNEVRGCRERDKDPECHFETPYVVRLHNFHQLADPKPCFTFVHPTTDMNNNRYQCLRFFIGCNSVLHGFAGYFEATLYKDVTLSIKPETHSPGMFSWFPILFPLKQPIPLSCGNNVSVRFWRCNNGKKVWYEWAVTEPICSAIHNPSGRSYTIGL
ncbi:protein arginine N-methyltransferase 5-like [Sinocyclocheilus rhinocerous]|uniref:protein arginine N-methyltransferase 5-like n=1 Tax=Sinocyclocheilus rhinocerous TaxID=307959 RepID=UPI0007B96F3B|nr:PREDICTED: protein arginine N-methyltransferase 5-like [Sinocyclocheilus rhinocerous]